MRDNYWKPRLHWVIIYTLVLIAIAFLLKVDAPAPEAKPKPAPETCLAPDGWTAAIEPAEGDSWACVMRKGKTTKAFFY